MEKKWFVFPPREQNNCFSLFSPAGTLTLNPTGTRALEQARGIREVTFVGLSPLDKLGRWLLAFYGFVRVRSAPTHDVLSKEMPAVSQPYFSTVTVTPRPVDPVSKQYFTFFLSFYTSLSDCFE